MTRPDLPAPFDTAITAAGVDHSRRYIGVTLDTPGTIARNTYQFAWLQIVELEPWRGEPLELRHAQRRQHEGSYERSPFTSRARDLIRSQLVPAVARYGFDRWWSTLWQAGHSPEAGAATADEARRIVGWWERQSELVALHHAGDLVIVPTIDGDRIRSQPVPTGPRGRDYVHVMGRAMHRGAHVGWFTDRADIIPTRDLLDPPPMEMTA